MNSSKQPQPEITPEVEAVLAEIEAVEAVLAEIEAVQARMYDEPQQPLPNYTVTSPCPECNDTGWIVLLVSRTRCECQGESS